MNLWQELEGAKQKLESITNDIANLKERIVEEHCPLKIGDVIPVPINAYVHQGKNMIITSISIKDKYYGGYEWFIKGNVLRQDGSRGKGMASFYVKVEDN